MSDSWGDAPQWIQSARACALEMQAQEELPPGAGDAPHELAGPDAVVPSLEDLRRVLGQVGGLVGE